MNAIPSMTEINKTSIARFGHDALTVDPMTALWLATHVATASGCNGRQVHRRISNARNKIGKGTAQPEYGTICF
jgi:hypothetical protein